MIGRASALARSVVVGSWKSTPASVVAHRLGGLGHERGVGRDADRQHDGALGAELLAISAPASIAARSPDTTTWPGELRLATTKVPWAERRGDELGQPRVVEADEGGHRAVAALARRLHQAAALADEADAVLEREDAGGDERGVLAHRVAGGEGRLRGREAGCGPALAQRLEDGDRRGEERGLGVLGQVQLLGRAVPGERADRLAEGGVGRGEHGRGGGRGRGEIPAHAHGLRALAGEDEGDR